MLSCVVLSKRHCLYLIDTDTIMQLFLSETVGLFLFILMTSTAGEVCRGPVCQFQFVVSRAQTMTTKIDGKVFNVQLNGTRLQVVENSLRRAVDYPGIIGRTVNPDDVITADGYSRDVIVINDQFPGPTIEVMKGVQVGYRLRTSIASSFFFLNGIEPFLAVSST